MSQYFNRDQDPAVHRRNKRGLDVTKHGKQGMREEKDNYSHFTDGEWRPGKIKG